jgi:hypothetical protein
VNFIGMGEPAAKAELVKVTVGVMTGV